MIGHSLALKRWIVGLSLILVALVGTMSFLLWQDLQSTQSHQPGIEDVSSIRIQRDAFADIVMSKKQDRWAIEAPCEIPVNEQRLKPLLSALEPGAHQYSAGEVDLLVAGLEIPLATVYLNEVEHHIGNTDLNGNRRYLQRGDKVEFVPEWVLSLVNGGVTALAQLELFSEPISKIKLAIDQAGNGMQAFRPDRPSLENADTWQNLSAQQIVGWPVDDAPELPSYTLTVTSQQDKAQTLKVFETPAYTAVQFDNADCAYLLAPDTLPD